MENDGENVIASARHRLSQLDPAIQEGIEQQIAYFENNKDRMLYKTYRQNGYFYGSRMVETDCRTVLSQRLKPSGVLWVRPGAKRVLELRCAPLGNRWKECRNRISGRDYLQIKAVA